MIFALNIKNIAMIQFKLNQMNKQNLNKYNKDMILALILLIKMDLMQATHSNKNKKNMIMFLKLKMNVSNLVKRIYKMKNY